MDVLNSTRIIEKMNHLDELVDALERAPGPDEDEYRYDRIARELDEELAQLLRLKARSPKDALEVLGFCLDRIEHTSDDVAFGKIYVEIARNYTARLKQLVVADNQSVQGRRNGASGISVSSG
jgi:hypothetical protein